MRVVFVVDSVADLKQKINTIKSTFGNDIVFIVKAHFTALFSTFGLTTNAVYYNNLSRVMHFTLNKLNAEDTVIYFSSLSLNNGLLNKFVEKIGNGDKIVNVMPKYNWVENSCNSVYNVYVKSLFKTKDSMASPKLQYLPAQFVDELLSSNIGNKLFELKPELVTTLQIEDKQLNKELKPTVKFNRFHLIPIIIALMLTYALILCLMFFKPNFFVILTYVFLYILDLTLAIIFQCKLKFDLRFLK